MGTAKRGRVIRDTTAGDGLVFVDGKQYLLRLESMWKSEFAPKVNMLVDLEFDERGRLTSARAAPVEASAADQTARVVSAAKGATRQLAQDAQETAAPVLARLAQSIGYPTLAAMVALLLGWFYFSVASLTLGTAGRVGVTFYQALKFLNGEGLTGVMAAMQGGGGGILGLVCFLCCIGGLLPWLWRDRRANFGMLAPLIFMVIVALLLRSRVAAQISGLQDTVTQFGSVGGAHARDAAAQMAAGMSAQIRNSISIDFGAWLSLAASLFLAWRGVERIRAGAPPDREADPDGDEQLGPRGIPAQGSNAIKSRVGAASGRSPSQSP